MQGKTPRRWRPPCRRERDKGAQGGFAEAQRDQRGEFQQEAEAGEQHVEMISLTKLSARHKSPAAEQAR